MSNTTAAGFIISEPDFIQLVIIANMAGWRLELPDEDGAAVFTRDADVLKLDKNSDTSIVTWEAEENIEDWAQLKNWIGNGTRK